MISSRKDQVIIALVVMLMLSIVANINQAIISRSQAEIPKQLLQNHTKRLLVSMAGLKISFNEAHNKGWNDPVESETILWTLRETANEATFIVELARAVDLKLSEQVIDSGLSDMVVSFSQYIASVAKVRDAALDGSRLDVEELEAIRERLNRASIPVQDDYSWDSISKAIKVIIAQ